jgi:hypothetical protein
MAVALFLALIAHLVKRFDLSRWFVIAPLACVVLYVLAIGLENAIYSIKHRKRNLLLSEGYTKTECDSDQRKMKRRANKTDAADTQKPRR